ncbi:hypothetical protein RB195_008594 [Necator americanus]|uniref:ABC transporter domain-containing protein n=1 Tax=Necator americanus TaxID=51031 RepID=A0ABR1CSR6_NECAM
MIISSFLRSWYQFVLLLRKQFLLGRREYLWTTCQILAPVLLGIPLMIHCYVFKKVPAYNSTQNFEIHPTMEIRGNHCTEVDFPYVIRSQHLEIEKFLEQTTLLRRNFSNVEEMYAELSKRAKEKNGSQDGSSNYTKNSTSKQSDTTNMTKSYNSSVVGVEFKSLTKDSLSYVLHATVPSLQDIMDLKALLTSETEQVDLRDTTNYLTTNDLEAHRCVIAGFLRGVQQPLEERKFERTFLFQTCALIVISFIVLFVTYNVVSDAEMKDFLIVMSVPKLALLLTSIIGNYIKTFISLFLVFIIPLSLDEEAPLDVTFIALELLGLNAAILGTFCGTVIRSTLGAIRLAIILWILLLYIGVYSPPINEGYWLVSINNWNPITAFKNIFQSYPYYDLRGTSVTMGTLFAYNDVVSPGSSIIALAFDSIRFIIIATIIDYIEWSYLGSSMAAIFRKKELEQLKSQSERHSWHQDEVVHEEKADIDAADVAKVWERSGELAVYRFEIRAYPGEVSVLLGHSGAGKSTVCKMICGIVRPTRGQIKILNNDLFVYKSLCRSRIGYCPQKNLLYDRMTVMEHLWFFYLLKRPKAKKAKQKWRAEAEVLIQSLDMDSFRDQQSRKLSEVEKRKLCIAIAFIGGSRVVLLDEPTNGMDPPAIGCLVELVQQQKDLRTIMLTTERMEDAEAMGQQLYVMYMGRTVCSGDINFVKSSFATEYMLTITPSDENFEETVKRLEEGVRAMVPGAKTRAKEGDQIRIELPKLQERLFPEMFVKLEEEKQMKFVKDYNLTYGVLEETFLKMGEKTEVDRSVEMEPLGTEPPSSFKSCLCMCRFIFLLWKKVLLSLSHFPLILSQLLIPIFVSIYLGYALHSDTELPGVRSRLSFASISSGRFLIFNPYNESVVSSSAIRTVNKYQHIEVLTFNDNNIELHWPKDWPWVVGGLLITKKDAYGEGINNLRIEFLSPKYISHSDLLMINIATDFLFAGGKLNLNIDFEMRLREDKFDRSNFILVPFIMMFICILLTSSFTIIPAEEQSCHFKHLQLTTGLSTFLYWFVTLLYDIVVIFVVCSLIFLILFLYGRTISVFFLLLMVLYCTICLPLAYLVSTLFSMAGTAFFLFVIFQSLAFIPLFLADGIIQPPISYIAFAYPSLTFMSAINDETGRRKLLNFSYAIYFIVLASIGVVYLFLLALYELHLHTSMMQLLKQKKFSEKFDVPYGNDVLAEKARVSRPGGNEVVLVKDLGKYHNKTFVLKNMTFALEKGDSFGLIGVSGSGKSVAFKLISGVDRPSCGKVLIHGKAPYQTSLGFCGSYDSLYPRLTCRQNVIIIAGMLGYRGVRQKADKLIGFVGLRLHGGKYVADCSESQKRRITVALALMTRAQLIVMDEPTKGVDPVARRDIWKLIRTTHLNDRILLFTSSSLEECEMLGSRYGVLYKGRFISTGTTDVLRGHHSRFCVLHMELTDVKRKQKVLDTVHDIFPNSNQVPVPESTKPLLKWRIPMSETESLSVFFRKTQQLASFIPAKDIRLTQATYDDALITLSDKFSNLQKRASEKELVNQLLTVIG